MKVEAVAHTQYPFDPQKANPMSPAVPIAAPLTTLKPMIYTSLLNDISPQSQATVPDKVPNTTSKIIGPTKSDNLLAKNPFAAGPYKRCPHIP
jgi:hypothetical protein